MCAVPCLAALFVEALIYEGRCNGLLNIEYADPANPPAVCPSCGGALIEIAAYDHHFITDDAGDEGWPEAVTNPNASQPLGSPPR